MSNFDWQTEEDDNWETELFLPPSPRQRRRFPWRMAVIIVGLLMLAGGVLYWQVGQRVAVANDAAEADVLSTYNLVNRVVAAQDVDLLSPLLSGRDMSWARDQEGLVAEGLFYDRTALGLTAVALPPVLSIETKRPYTLTLSPNLDAAELTFTQPYLVEVTGEEVLLAHTAVYRLGRERWLLAPPEPEFWGEWQTTETGDITFIYPARDAEVAERLAQDLAANLEEICRSEVDFTCPPLSDLQMRFETSPASLQKVADPTEIYARNLQLKAPTPTLVGLPLDEAGYEALLTGYTRLLAMAVIADAVGYECCDQAPLFQVLLDYQLYRLGLRGWPATRETYKRVAANDAGLPVLARFWAADDFALLQGEDGWQAYAFVDFVATEQPSLSPADLLRGLLAASSFNQWLKAFSGGAADGPLLLNRLAQSWWLYAQARLQETAEPSSLTLPAQDLQLICTRPSLPENNPGRAELYRLHWQDGRWQITSEMQFPGFMFFNPLPDDSGVVLQGIDFENDRWRTTIWQNGAGFDLLTNEAQFFFSLGQTDPNSRYLLVYQVDESSSQTNPALLDLQQCSGDNCSLTLLTGNLLWSPDGRQTVLQPVNEPDMLRVTVNNQIIMFGFLDLLRELPILRGDALGAGDPAPVAEGTAPFWLSETEYGFVRHPEQPVSEAGTRIMMASITDDEVRPLLSSLDLRQSMPPKDRPARLTIQYAMANPANPDQLAVLATAQSTGHLFLVDRASGETEWRLSFRIEGNHAFGFSPDGRYLVTTGVPLDVTDAPGTVNAYFLHDIARNETHTVFTDVSTPGPSSGFDWSADGAWLALLVDERFVHLIAPESDYRQNVWLDLGSCSSIAWVDGDKVTR